MITALIFAGGAGIRMNTAGIPKQFLKIYGKPIIAYTIEIFQNHEMIDNIVVVSIESHIDYTKEIVKNYNFTKVSCVVPGSDTGQKSIWNGLEVIKNLTEDDDMVLINDGVRPLVTTQLITDNIESVRKNGNGISACFAWETICHTKDGKENIIGNIIPREKCLLVKAPQSFRVRDIVEAHSKAKNEGITSAIDSASLMSYYGHTLYYVLCEPSNIKITTPVDFYLFKAMLEAQESMQIIGFE